MNTQSEAAVRAVIEATAVACRAKNVEMLIAHYAPDVVAFDLINPLRYFGVGEVGTRAKDWFESFRGFIEYEIRDLDITAAVDVAFCHSLNRVKGTKLNGELLEMWWRETLCFQRRNETWLVTHSHSSVPFDMHTGKTSFDIKP